MRSFLTLCLLITLTSCSSIRPIDRTPEAASGHRTQKLVTARKVMIATANPYASRAGFAVLEQGGSAVDAAIVATMVLTLVEPQSSGLGGGAFALTWDNRNQQVHSYDGRETAPQSAPEDLFYDEGQPLAFQQAVAGGRSVGVPGLLKMLETMHRRHGKLPWPGLFDTAIRLAEEGFDVSPRLADAVNGYGREKLQRQDAARDYFFPKGQPIVAGQRLKNPQLAKTLRRIAAEGSKALYRGVLAEQIVEAIKSDPNPGRMELADLADYQAPERPAVCAPFYAYTICGMGPPSSGGLTSLQMLGLLEALDIRLQPAGALQAWHLFAQAGRLAFADRAAYIADPEFIDVPIAGLLDRNYLQQRAMEIDPKTDRGPSSAGKPPGLSGLAPIPGYNPDLPGTSHLSIVDRDGNAVALTASIEQGFGSGLLVNGFLLNNQLTDFSFAWQNRDGSAIANRVQGGKRPRSSMAPTLVIDRDRQLKMVIGSPGGSRIIPYVVQSLLGVLVWRQDIQTAIDQPHATHTNGPTFDLEKGTSLEQLQPALEQRGYQVRVRDLNSGLHGIVVTSEGLEGGADPRREGLVLGE